MKTGVDVLEDGEGQNIRHKDELAGLMKFIEGSPAVVRPDEAKAIVALGRMVRMVSRMRRHQLEISERVGLNVGDLDILYLLQRSTADQRPRVTDLATLLAVTPGGISKRIDRLEAAALIEREWTDQDRRTCRIAPTEKALELVEHARTVNRSGIIQALSTKEWSQLDDMLKRLMDVGE